MLTLAQTPLGPRYLPGSPTDPLPDGGLSQHLPATVRGPWAVISSPSLTEEMRAPPILAALYHLYPEAIYVVYQIPTGGEYQIWAYHNPVANPSADSQTVGDVEVHWTQTGDILRPE